MMSLNHPMITANMVTPMNNIKAQMKHSIVFCGWKSPKPTVESVVKAKYVAIKAYFSCEICGNPYSVKKLPAKSLS